MTELAALAGLAFDCPEFLLHGDELSPATCRWIRRSDFILDGVSFEGTPPNFVEMAEKIENCRKELCDSYFDFDFIAEQIERELREVQK